jgi:hypothetical protein
LLGQIESLHHGKGFGTRIRLGLILVTLVGNFLCKKLI